MEWNTACSLKLLWVVSLGLYESLGGLTKTIPLMCNALLLPKALVR